MLPFICLQLAATN